MKANVPESPNDWTVANYVHHVEVITVEIEAGTVITLSRRINEQNQMRH